MSTLLAPAPVPTLSPGSFNTIVAQTAGAAATQTAALLPPTLTPTATLPPTRTPTQTPSLTPTFLFILPTLTRTPTPGESSASGGLGCALVSQSPQDDSKMSKNQAFTMSWKVRNTGSATWDENAVDFVYVSGAKLADVKAVDLPKSVEPDGTVTLKVDMVAPSRSGSVRTVWALHQGKTDFCRLNITINVP